MLFDEQPWNVDIHYDALLESKVPLAARQFPRSGASTEELRGDARALLPGAEIRRLLYGRALISWRAPG